MSILRLAMRRHKEIGLMTVPRRHGATIRNQDKVKFTLHNSWLRIFQHQPVSYAQTAHMGLCCWLATGNQELPLFRPELLGGDTYPSASNLHDVSFGSDDCIYFAALIWVFGLQHHV